MKRVNTKQQQYSKLPAMRALPEALVANVDELPLHSTTTMKLPLRSLPETFQEIFFWESSHACYLFSDFYNGAMNTDQCHRLAKALDHVKEHSHKKVLVLIGGLNFFSNGIHLNTIEAASNPAHESMRNITAIDDVVQKILLMDDRLTVSALVGNAGAGGAMMALAADFVWIHPRVAMNPSYKAMHLYGSEYWTYSLPRRVGADEADRLVSNTQPVSAAQALRLGLADRIRGHKADDFVERVLRSADRLGRMVSDQDLCKKRDKVHKPSFQQELAAHRAKELKQMQVCFDDPDYHRQRRVFVYKHNNYLCARTPIEPRP